MGCWPINRKIEHNINRKIESIFQSGMRRGGAPLWGTDIGKLLWKNNNLPLYYHIKIKIYSYMNCVKRG